MAVYAPDSSGDMELYDSLLRVLREGSREVLHYWRPQRVAGDDMY